MIYLKCARSKIIKSISRTKGVVNDQFCSEDTLHNLKIGINYSVVITVIDRKKNRILINSSFTNFTFMRKLPSFTKFACEIQVCTCINCNGYISLHAWLNIADQKWLVIWTQYFLAFLLCNMRMRIALTCIVPGATPGVLHQYNIKYSVHLFVFGWHLFF